MAWIFVVLSLLYGLPIAAFAIGHYRVLRRANLWESSDLKLSVIIAFRNEASGIRDCLLSILRQEEVSEIVVIDDHSTDDSWEIVTSMIEHSSGRIVLLKNEMGIGKKAAILQGVNRCKSELILVTDADCIVPLGWAREMRASFDKSTGFVVGPVVFSKSRRWASHMISLEWIGFMGIAAGAIGLGTPILCSGANIAYRKSVFEEVGGYEGLDRFSSGDDELLMQQIADETNWKVRFCASRRAVVETAAPGSASEFLAQRRRWASKGAFYKRKWLVAMNIGFWIFFLAVPVGLVASIWVSSIRIPLAIALTIKVIPEAALLAQSAHFYEMKHLMRFFLPAQPFQIAYILWAGVAGVRGNLEWKSRKLVR